MEFCPTCGNMLQYELPYMGRNARFFCSACPYVCQIEKRVKIKRRQRLVKKEIEPIISPDDVINAPTTEATCPKCNHGKAASGNFRLDQLMNRQLYFIYA
ncbi:DNA-directed RNA polymerase III subunit RPC10 [Spatholobus suberectus]|nr:DNA-directed RNA polymerase III subunit RPC10 [Spatholobus suberectus]